MAPEDDDSWPPGNIREMIAEMRSDLASPHWNHVRLQVYGFARRYSIGTHEYLTDAEDITQDVMWILTKPGKLEAFGRKARVETAGTGEDPVLRTTFLAWLAVITHRQWLNFARYTRARPDLASRVPMENNDGDDTSVAIPDPCADIPQIVDEKMMLEAVIDYLRTLQSRDPETARKVAQLALLATTKMSYEEIARQFDCKVPQVRDAIHRIRSLLRKRFSMRENTPDESPYPDNGTRQ